MTALTVPDEVLELIGYAAVAMHVCGAFSALHAIWCARTVQASIAWAVGLVAFPYLGVPLYWIFGRSRFQGYVQARRSKDHLGRFMHQKVVLVDDRFASVGTANFSNRSFRLNFEINLAVLDRPFALEIEQMLERDIAASKELPPGELGRRSYPFRFAVRIARLFSKAM